MRILREIRFRLGSARHAHRLHREIGILHAANQEVSEKLRHSRNDVESLSSEIRKLRAERLKLPSPLEQDRVKIMETFLRHLPVGRLLDLGCGHGKFSLAAADLGWEVTGVDIRSNRTPEDDRVRWVEADITSFQFDAREYDCVTILGLLYHLQAEEQLALLASCSQTLTILDTHTATIADATEAGYSGWIYEEPKEDKRRAIETASWDNETSFWATEESLLRMILDSGYTFVTPLRPPNTLNRTFYVCYP